MSEKRHICFFIPSLSTGGAERIVSLLANKYIADGYKITVVCLIDKIAYDLHAEVVIYIPDFEIKRNFKCLLQIISYYRRTVRQIKPDIMLSFTEFYNEIVLLSLIGIKKKIFVFDRNNPFLKEQNLLQKVLRYILYPKADGVVVQTADAFDFITNKKLNKNVLVLPNPISEINYKWVPQENNVITCVGRLEHQKNHKYLIKIFSEIENEGWILQIVGDGSLKEELESYAKSLNSGSKIKFLGLRKDVFKILSESTIFAFPSLWEGYPNALLEAMAIGVPCISNNCSTGPKELIKDGHNGYLAEVNNSEEFKRKLTILMNSDKIRNSFSMYHNLIRNKHNIENVRKRLDSFISGK